MGKRKKVFKKKNNNLSLAVFFSLFVGLLIVISLSVKVVTIFAQSSFDAQHRFTIALVDNSESTAKKGIDIISLAPDDQSISVLTVAGDIKLSELEEKTGIYIDGVVGVSDHTHSVGSNVSPTFRSLLLKYPVIETDLTIVDIARMWFFARTVKSHSISVKDKVLSAQTDVSEELLMDKLVSQLFIDQTILNERVTVQVINATGIPGVASNVARILTNMGVGVVSVSSQDAIQKQSKIIYSGVEETYTLQKLLNIFDTTGELAQNTSVSDIVVIIGQDSVKSQGL